MEDINTNTEFQLLTTPKRKRKSNAEYCKKYRSKKVKTEAERQIESARVSEYRRKLKDLLSETEPIFITHLCVIITCTRLKAPHCRLKAPHCRLPQNYLHGLQQQPFTESNSSFTFDK